MTTQSKTTPTLRRGRPAQGHGQVYEIREALGISQDELAARIGMKRRQVAELEALGTIPRSAGHRGLLRTLALKHGLDALLWPERDDERAFHAQ